jgi:hypothetical protein
MENPEAVQWLAAAVAAYPKPDTHAKAVLGRLQADKAVAAAFAAVCPNEPSWRILLADCVQAERLAREHPYRLKTLRALVKDIPVAIEALRQAEGILHPQLLPDRRKAGEGRLHYSVARLDRPDAPVEEQAALERKPETLSDPIRDAFALLHQHAQTQLASAEDWLARVSQRSYPPASRALGIAWIKGSVLALSGAPNLDHVITLAEPALGTDEPVTKDAIRKVNGLHRRTFA